MATPMTHSFTAVVLGAVCGENRPPRRFWILAIICATLPDLDVIAFSFGIPYEHLFGHRGFTHSLFFALLVGASVPTLFFRKIPFLSDKWWGLTAFFFLVTASHGLLDMMTNGGKGIAIFAPFDNGRYFLPWRPLEVSPLGIKNFFSPRGWKVLAGEFLWVWVPGLVVLVAVKLLVRGGQREERSWNN